MSRVPCSDCGIAVVVDPNGVCPDGHTVGAAGARVENAMGASEPHPDEPEPWVARVELDDVEPRPAAKQRAIRPVAIGGSESEGAGNGRPADQESMLRELHALGELQHPSGGEPTPGRPPVPTAVPQPPAPSAPAAAPTAPAAHQDAAEGFAELSALEAAVQALGFQDDPAPRHDRDLASQPAPTPDHDDLDGFAELFAQQDEPATPAPADPPPGAASPAPPPPPPGPAPATAPAPAAAEPVAEEAADDAPTPEPSPSSDGGLDIANFTSRGSRVGAGRGGGRRKRFGR